jgi:hypothetical protein
MPRSRLIRRGFSFNFIKKEILSNIREFPEGSACQFTWPSSRDSSIFPITCGCLTKGMPSYTVLEYVLQKPMVEMIFKKMISLSFHKGGRVG